MIYSEFMKMIAFIIRKNPHSFNQKGMKSTEIISSLYLLEHAGL